MTVFAVEFEANDAGPNAFGKEEQHFSGRQVRKHLLEPTYELCRLKKTKVEK